MSALRLPGKVLVPALAFFLASPVAIQASTEDDPFEKLRGKWGGSGVVSYSDSTKERLTCNAEYSGSNSLRLVIDCRGPSRDIKLRATLSSNAGRLAGTWNEQTFNLVGLLAGKMTDKRIDFRIGGGLVGKMNVAYTQRRQRVSISVKNVVLENVSINMSRR